jgi:hypothetical protein
MNNFDFCNNKEIDVICDISFSEKTYWEIFIGSSWEKLISFVDDLFIYDQCVKVKKFTNGCDLLVAVVNEIPDLVIIDENLPGVPLIEFMNCIKRTESLKDIKLFCILESCSSSIEKTCKFDYFIKSENLDQVNIARKLNSLIYKSTIHRDKRTEPGQIRKWPRINMNIGTRVEIFNPLDGSKYAYGTAKIKNISREGACISQIQLNNGILPSSVFNVRLRANEHPLNDWKADSLVIRAEEDNSARLKFINISKEDKNKIMDYFE